MQERKKERKRERKKERKKNKELKHIYSKYKLKAIKFQ